MKSIRVALFFLTVMTSFLFTVKVFAQAGFSSPEPVLNITASVQMALAPEDLQDPAALEFKSGFESIGHGYTHKNAWLRIHLKNDSGTAKKRILFFNSPMMGKLTLIKNSWLPGHEIFSGPGFPLAERAYPERLGGFEILLDANEEADFYVKRDSHHAFNTHVYLANRDTQKAQEAKVKSIFFFYLGGILCLVIYNFVLGISTRQQDYLLYSLFAASFCAAALGLHGVLDAYILPNSYIVFSNYLMFFSSLALFSGALFVERFLFIKKNFLVGYWGLRVIRAGALVPLIASPFVPHFHSLFFLGYWIDIFIAIGVIFFIYCGLYVSLKYRNALGYYFLLSWLAVFTSISMWILSVHGFIQYTSWTQYSLLLGNMAEMLILALGLAYKIKTLNDEKRRALQAAEDKERYHRLVKVLSHDVANAVSGLGYHSEMLGQLTQGDLTLSGHNDKIQKSTRHLSDMLMSVRQEEVFFALKADNDTEAVDLAEACEEAKSLHLWRMSEKNIQVHIDVPIGKRILANRFALINQVICNLISNALKFSDEGGEIFITYSEERSEKILSIRDHGVGMLSDQVHKIFKTEALFSTRGTANEVGTGLGTKLVSEYMKLFGGRVEVTSVSRHLDKNSGTTVRLIFTR